MPSESNLDAAPAPAPYTERFVDVAGLRLHLHDYGTSGRRVMLCLHGGAANAHWYDFVAAGFTGEYHVLAVDLRGHGDSEWDRSLNPDYSYARHAADVDELVRSLGLRDFVLVGHSMGGMVSCVYAATYPGRARALIVVDSNLVMTPERIAAYNKVGNREGRSYPSEEEFVASYRVRPGGSTAHPQVLRYIARHSGRRFDDGLWRHKVDRKVYANRELVDSFGLWDRIRIPSLLMKAELSARVTPEAIAEIKSRAPQLQVAMVPAADHHVTLDNPQGFIQAAKGFLASIG